MSKVIQAIRGMNDILPQQGGYWHHLRQTFVDLMEQYCYQEIQFPICEMTSLFKRTIGQATDIVEKEMYTFEDRNGDSISLRPEGTAGCVRAGIQHGLFYNQWQKLWYCGPMFRHERPQKGRYRQFNQFGVECFGFSGAAIELELLLMIAGFWKTLNLDHSIVLQINSLGSSEDRQRFAAALTEYLRGHYDQLDADSQRRLDSNPLRILDSKDSKTIAIIADAPQLHDFISEQDKQQFSQLCDMLTELEVPYTINPLLVRGLDYYTGLVFEWVTDELGAQGTVCAGGRYDGLVEKLGGKATPAVGFAMGLERLICLLEIKMSCVHYPDVYIMVESNALNPKALDLADQLRSSMGGLRVKVDIQGGSLKKQFKRAEKSQAKYIITMTDDLIEKEQLEFIHREQKSEREMLSPLEVMQRIQTEVVDHSLDKSTV